MSLEPSAGRSTDHADRTTGMVGMVAAGSATILSVAYGAAQILEWLGALGSRGGPSSQSTASGLVVLLTPSLLLAPAFLIVMCAVHHRAPDRRRIFSLVALAFAVIYATLVSLVYYVQLTLVAPHLVEGRTEGFELLLFVPYRSFLFAIDLLGYTFMCLSLLSGAFALPTGRWSRQTKSAMIATGALAPFLAFQMYEPRLIAIAALWGVTFPAAMLSLALSIAKGMPRDS